MNFIQYYIENFDRIIFAARTHLLIFIIALTGAVILGVTLSIIITWEERESLGKVILSIMGAAQSIPSIVSIAFIFIFVGIGIKPTITALVLYSLVPIIFNSTSGLLSVPYDIIDAGKGMGYTNSQILWKIKIPIALPIIMGGIRSSATIIIGSAAVAAVIGGGGLGDFILIGLRMHRIEMLLAGALTVAAVALIIDTIIGKIETIITPKGLK
jgi:osmoprotectant transport system permease protein